MATKKQKEQAWEKAKTIRKKNPDVWRRDSAGNVIKQGSYGTHGEYGWDVHHIKPIAKGGSDVPSNLQALQWEENIKKSDKT